MQTGSAVPKNIDEYIACFPPEIQDILQRVRSAIRKAAPQATEKISYQMPCFYLHGNLVYFAAFKKHIGFYPVSSGIAAFKNELDGLTSGKGSVQFPLNKPIPYDLITRITEFRVAENSENAKAKLKKG